jgi:hypothetical protein
VRERPVPRFVECELRSFLGCGILAHDDAAVARVVGQVAKRIARPLERRCLGPESDPLEADPSAEEQPLLAQLTLRPSRLASPPGAARASACCSSETASIRSISPHSSEIASDPGADRVYRQPPRTC